MHTFFVFAAFTLASFCQSGGAAPSNPLPLISGCRLVLLDEICAWVILRKMQTTGVTSKMETRYMKPISTNDSHIVLRASIKEVKRNIILVDAAIYNNKEELCTKALCTYFTFSKEKSKDEMHFSKCDVESEEILPLI